MNSIHPDQALVKGAVEKYLRATQERRGEGPEDATRRENYAKALEILEDGLSSAQTGGTAWFKAWPGSEGTYTSLIHPHDSGVVVALLEEMGLPYQGFRQNVPRSEWQDAMSLKTGRPLLRPSPSKDILPGDPADMLFTSLRQRNTLQDFVGAVKRELEQSTSRPR